MVEETRGDSRRWTEPMLLGQDENIAKAWRVFFETGDESLLVEVGIFPPRADAPSE